MYISILSKIILYFHVILFREGFNLLLYGFGSKRQIINDFKTSLLENESVLVVNGFFPGLTLKEVRTASLVHYCA